MEIDFGRHMDSRPHGYGDPGLIGKEALVSCEEFSVSLEPSLGNEIERLHEH
jgi:hypothetical protein